MERYDFRPRPIQTSTTEALLLEGFAREQVAEDPDLTTRVTCLATGFYYCRLDWGLP